MFKRIYPTQENKTTLRHRQFGLRSRHCSRISSVSQRLHYEETHIFGATDGSKTSEGNGAGVFDHEPALGTHGEKFSIIFRAEIHATGR